MEENETKPEFMDRMGRIISTEKVITRCLNVMNECGVSRKTIDKFLDSEVQFIFGNSPTEKES